MEVRVSKDRDLHEGDLLTFFYPSREWHMAQPFECNCYDPGCLGAIMGASELGKARLDGYWLNQHIKDRLENQAETEIEETLRQTDCEKDERDEKVEKVDRAVI